MSSWQPISAGFLVSGSKNFLMHLPNFSRPYLALVMTMTWPDLHSAVNVSQLQNSLRWSKQKSLLYNILSTAHFMWLLGVYVHRLGDASSVFHPSIAGVSHQNHLTWFASGIEGLPVAIFSDQAWIKNSYFIISSAQPISAGFWVSKSMNLRMHFPNFIRPYFALVISITSPDLHFAVNVSQLQNSLRWSE